MSASDGRVIGLTTVVNNGPSASRFDLVIVAEGYRESEMPKFRTDVDSFLTQLWATDPFPLLRRAMNVHRLEVASTDSGADDPGCGGGSAITARTYFDARFCTSSVERLLTVNDTLAISTVTAKLESWNLILVLVNSSKYGGAGGAVATCSTNPSAAEIAIHEMGHTAFGLADEYDYYLGCGIDTDKDNHAAAEPGNANVTVQSRRADLPWVDLVTTTTAVPTLANLNCGVCDTTPSPVTAGTVGLFEGAHYHHCGCYRPEFDCKMRNLGRPFCKVCNRKIRFDLHPFYFNWPETLRGNWSKGWAVVVPFTLGGHSHLFSYNAGRVSIDRVRLDGKAADPVSTDSWSLGWSTVMPFFLNGAPHLLSYKVGSGQVSIDRIQPAANGYDTLYSDTWTTGWSTFMPFSLGGRPHYLAYKIATGQVTIDVIRPDGSGVDTLYSDFWSLGWSHFVPFLLQGQPAYVGYKISTGQMTIDRILPGGTGVDTVFSETWTTGWSSFAPFNIGPDWFYLAYKVGTGQMTVDRVKPTGLGVDTIYRSLWTAGWSTLVPLNLGSVPFYFGYKIAEGTVTIGPI